MIFRTEPQKSLAQSVMILNELSFIPGQVCKKQNKSYAVLLYSGKFLKPYIQPKRIPNPINSISPAIKK